ncbi:MAG: putative metal-binding motif-containing protein, partial [Myxococcota bacterium]
MRQLWKGSAGLVGCLFASALLFWPQSADARSDGVLDFGCTGCHGTADIDVELTLEPEVFDPGDTVTLELRVSGASGESFGFFLGVSNGALVSTAGARGTDTDITHSTPVGFDGTGTFSVAWESPEEPGPTRFDLAAVIANGNGTRNGDHAREVTIQRVFGCPPQTFYRDVDDDGFGNPDSTVLDCAGTAPFGAASNPDDCDDFDNDRFPGATEQCNRVDDDCDGDVDEDSETVTLYPDGDGDGFYGIEEANSGTPIEGCLEPGFAALGGDCAPDDPTRNPGAEEVCNTLDDDCDAFIDERVRPVCGVG